MIRREDTGPHPTRKPGDVRRCWKVFQHAASLGHEQPIGSVTEHHDGTAYWHVHFYVGMGIDYEQWSASEHEGRAGSPDDAMRALAACYRRLVDGGAS